MKIELGSTLLLAGTALMLASCTAENSPGIEYMPDMYRSPAIEAYVDYGQDPYHYSEELAAEQRMRPSARVPAEGSIPYSMDTSKARFNMPYDLPNSDEGYTSSIGRTNPIPMTEASVAQGKILYERFCDHCHGATGKGDGPVVNVGGHPPPTAFNGPLKDRTQGQIFHVVTYGKGVMGPHAPLLTKEERWLVARYVNVLQNGGKMPGATATSDTTATDTTATAAPAATPANNQTNTQ